MEANIETPKAGGAISRGMPVPDAILDAVIEAVNNHEQSIGLDDETIRLLAIEAIHEGTLDDNNWLEEKLIAIKSGELIFETVNPEALETKIKSFEEELSQIIVSEPQNVTNQEELKEIVRLHEVWMDSILNPSKETVGMRANFEGMNLSGFDFSYANLSCANFKSSNLVGAKFEGAILSKANFECADLQGADLSKAKFRKSNLKEAKLEEAEINEADFKGAILEGTCLEGKVLGIKAEEQSETVDPFMMI